MQPIEMEGVLDQQAFTAPEAGGLGAIVITVLSAAAWWWSRRAQNPRADADHAADIARARFDESSARTASAVLEMLRQQLSAQQAEILDLKNRQEEQRVQTDVAKAEVLQLRQQLAGMQEQLWASESKRVAAEQKVQALSGRVELLEGELRKHGIEVPR